MPGRKMKRRTPLLKAQRPIYRPFVDLAINRIGHALRALDKHQETLAAHWKESARLVRQKARLAKRIRIARCHHTRISYVLRSRLTNALNVQGARKSAKTLRLLGCSIPELRHYLANQFQIGMCWENHGAWHIDHIRPCASFDLREASQQRVCFHYSNLQPLWKTHNLRKGKTWSQ